MRLNNANQRNFKLNSVIHKEDAFLKFALDSFEHCSKSYAVLLQDFAECRSSISKFLARKIKALFLEPHFNKVNKPWHLSLQENQERSRKNMKKY